jgi:hypothetical protein
MRTASVTIKQTVILIGVVVVLVFVVTYATTILGTTREQVKQGQVPGVPDLQLAFASPTTVPVPTPDKGDAPPPPWEWQAPGHHDFWFRNDRADPVQVAVTALGCAACTQVEMCVLPDELKGLKPEELDTRADDASLPWQLLDSNHGFTVPAHAAGGVRLKWQKKERAFGPQMLSAELGTESNKSAGHSIKLQVGLAWVDPVMIGTEEALKEPPKEGKAGEVSVGTLLAGDVKTVNLLCWSLTRASFTLKPEPPDDPCVTCDKPERLTEDECKKLSDENKIPTPILCAYRVPLTVRERTDGGKQLDMGRFRRTVKFTTDATAEVGQALIIGSVRGDITVGTDKERDLVLLGSFKRDEGTTKEVALTTERAGLDLEVDSKDTTPLVTVELREEKGLGLLGKTWTLAVSVPSDTLSGPIPPHSYIVLKTKGDKPRRMFIPVIGNAYVP